jgi:hypothetical protein
MVERDYIMRLMHDFFDALARLLTHIEADQFDTSHQYLKELYEQYFKQHRTFFLESGIEELQQSLKSGDLQTDVLKSEMLAELLLADARLHQSTDIQAQLLSKALALFQFAETNSDTYSANRLSCIATLCNELGV